MANQATPPETSQLTVNIPLDLKRRAKAQAALIGLTWDAAIRAALEAWLAYPLTAALNATPHVLPFPEAPNAKRSRKKTAAAASVATVTPEDAPVESTVVTEGSDFETFLSELEEGGSK